jgi:hypothetical protein
MKYKSAPLSETIRSVGVIASSETISVQDDIATHQQRKDQARKTLDIALQHGDETNIVNAAKAYDLCCQALIEARRASTVNPPVPNLTDPYTI